VNGVHDVAGIAGHGPVKHTAEEPVFEQDWERAAFAMFVPSLLAGLNLDEIRHGIEKMPPAEYLTAPYYEHWVHTFTQNLLDKGVISEKDLEDRLRLYREDPDAPLPVRQDPGQVQMHLGILATGASTRMPVDGPAGFSAGDSVRVKNLYPEGHTRLAAYVRGKTGVVDRVQGSFLYPDSHAHGQGPDPRYVYNVRFRAADLWGDEASAPNEAVYVDLWEPYLEATGRGATT
jgi:nitrile hydratase